MSTVKKYKLLKDLPDAKTGDMYVFHTVLGIYRNEIRSMSSDILSVTVENNPEWFSPVIEEQVGVVFFDKGGKVNDIVWSGKKEEQPQRIELSHLENHSFWVSGDHKDRCWYQFMLNKPIPQEKLKELSNLIERFVNGEMDNPAPQPTTSVDKGEEKQPLFITEDVIGCGICGGKLVKIRGRYPGDIEREVCPTCAVERLEMINEISDKDYRKSYQSIN